MNRLLALLPLAILLAMPAGALAQTPQQPQTLQPSSNWSGYVAGNAYYTGVSALIQAPLPYAFQSLGVVASWVGIGGSTSHDLIQAGVEEVNQGQFVAYRAWYELLPQSSRNIVLDIAPGAWVSVDVHQVGFNLWQVTIVNGTNVFQRQFEYASSHSSAEWVVEEPALYNGQLLPLAGVTGASFGKMSAIANGVTANPSQLFPQTVGIVSRLGLVRAAPTGFGPDNASFTVTTI
ncbi:MAG: G1 family glutamic endopeptidase [Chloroflexota bacterium]